MTANKLLTLIEEKMPEWFVNVGTLENPELVNIKQLIMLKLMDSVYKEETLADWAERVKNVD
jgi:hypothetical protein